jgi:hypothetical protein
MNVLYPLFAFEKDDSSIRLIEDERDILSKLETIDIENDEYVVWEAEGAGVALQVSVGAFKSKLISVAPCAPSYPIRDAFNLYAGASGLPEPVAEGTPTEMRESPSGRTEKRKKL